MSPKCVGVVCAVLAMAAGLAGCTATRAPANRPPRESLGDYMARVRARAVTSGVRRPSANLQLAEAADPLLREALTVLASGRSAARHGAVAAAYLRLGIRDLAFDHFTSAAKLDPEGGAAYDGLARIWRDWGFPALALSDAHRAVYRLPQSAASRNTLGTVLQALGLRDEARRAYQQALSLDAQAAWAHNNLCTLDLDQGRVTEAARHCRRALALDPGLLAARRNLVLAESAGATAPAPALAVKPPV